MAKVPKCKVCKTPYEPFTSLQTWCSPDCGYELSKRNLEKKAKSEAKIMRKDTRERKIKLKSKSDWLKEAQAAFNKYVRLRDVNEPCISCGRHHSGQYHAGHYLSVGAHPELRFHTLNNNKQCAPCNNHLSGNQVNYRSALIRKIGVSNVEWLEGKQEAQNLSIEDIQDIKAYYREQIKLIQTFRQTAE